MGSTEINFVKEISAKAHGDGYMSFSSNFWLDFVTVWGVIRLNLEPTQKADCISRIFIPKIDFPGYGVPGLVTGCRCIKKGLLQKTNLRQALIYIHFHTEDRILPQIVENFSHFGHAYAGSTVLVGPES